MSIVLAVVMVLAPQMSGLVTAAPASTQMGTTIASSTANGHQGGQNGGH